MLPRVYLIRHGETEWSRAGRHTSRTDVPLTAHGEEQARELGQFLRGITFARVLTSPAGRARRTAEIALAGSALTIDPDLAEWDYGDYEGRLTLDIQKIRPGWNVFRDGCPGGESPAQISDRADRVVARLRSVPGNIALFSHGHFGRMAAVRWIGLAAGQAQNFLLATASVSILGHEHDRADQPAIVLWNEGCGPISESLPAVPGSEAHAGKRRMIERWENEGGEIPEVPRNEARS